MANVLQSSGVYLIHLERKLSHAQHYCGYSSDIPARFDAHMEGRGSPMLRACLAVGIGFEIVRCWLGASRSFERRLKNSHQLRRYCPVCLAEE